MGRLVALALLAVAFAPPAGAQARRALVVGVDEYARADEGPFAARPIPPLRGAVNDAEAVAALLVARFGFAEDDVVVLTDAEATRDAVLTGLADHLCGAAEPGDLSLLFFAGHGWRIESDLDAGPEGKDQVLLTHDFARTGRGIWDKELKKLLGDAARDGVCVTAFFDCCFGGSATRAQLARTSYVGDRALVGWDPRPAREVYAGSPVLEGVDVASLPAPADLGAIVMSAATEYQVAGEVEFDVGGEPRVHGLFSAYLRRALRRAPADEPARDLLARVRTLMASQGRFQEPELEPPGCARSVWHGHRVEGDGAVRVAVREARGDGTFLLAGGAAVGLAAGCRLRPCDAGGEVDEDGCTLEVERVLGASRSLARASGAGARPEAGDLARVTAWVAAPGARIGLFVGAPLEGGIPDELVDALRARAERGEIELVTDPVRAGGDATPEVVLDADLDPASLEAGARVRVLVPPTSALARGIVPAALDGLVALHDDPAPAQVHLVGVVTPEGVRYRFVLAAARDPSSDPDEVAAIPLPTRSGPILPTDVEGARTWLRTLTRIQHWLAVQAPGGGEPFPYRLEVCTGPPRTRDPGTGARRWPPDGALTPVGDEPVVDGTPLYVRLVGDEEELAFCTPRYVYVFVLDGAGNGACIYPWRGATHNLLPRATGDPEPILRLRPGRAQAPFGTDTFVLITSEEQFTHLEELRWSADAGLERASFRGDGTDVEELLFGLGTNAVRGDATPQDWSIQRVFVRTRAAESD